MTGRFAAPSGREVYFEATGATPRVLALHGVGGGAYFFHGLAERLALRHAILSVDLPATGRSTGTAATLTMQDWLADLRALIDAALEPPVAVIGHSLGTILALELWRMSPDRIRGLAFVGGVPAVRQPVRERLASRIAAIAEEGIAGWGPKVSPANFSPASMHARPEVVGLFERLFELQRAESYIKSVEILLAASSTDVVPAVTVPVLSVSGADDLYAPPEAVAAFLDALPQPARRIVLPDVGHLPFYEAPDAFAEAVGEFLDGLAAA